MAVVNDAAQRPYPIRAGLLSGLLLLPIVAVAVAFLGGRTRPLASQSTAPVPVTSVIVRPRSVDLVRSGLGVVQAWNMATITPQVSGMLIDLPFREGQEVRAGNDWRAPEVVSDLLLEQQSSRLRSALAQGCINRL